MRAALPCMTRTLRTFLLMSLIGCIPVAQPTQPVVVAPGQVDAHANMDAQMLARIDQARAAATTGGAKEAWAFAREVESAYALTMVSRGKVDGVALTNEASRYLDAAAATEPGQMLAAKGSLLLTAGRRDEAVAALEASFSKPNLWPVARLLEVYSEVKPDAIAGVCKKARPLVKDEDQRFALLDQCMQWGKSLAWASKADVAYYEQERQASEQKASADNAAWREKQDRERAAMYASFEGPKHDTSPSSPPKAASPSGGSVSVKIRSRCSKTVRVFYGEKPKYGSGTNSSISSNSVQNHSFRTGDMMWIIDDHENGLSSTQVSANTREIEISSTCNGFTVR
jgi:hypothetical protein